jgi:sulfate/thiosulfate transport system substrate-binding protein
MTRTTPLKWFGAAALSLTVLASTSACSDPASGSSSGDKKQVSIVGFSILKTANKQVIADFQKTKAGKDVEFKESYGASGDQARAVIAGLKADEVHLSLEPDMTKLTDENLVDQDWKSGPTKGIATQSVVAIVTRPGNPKKITGWDDLAKPGIKIVTPNPGSSGSAKWNILAAYQHIIDQGGSESDAADYLKSFFKNVVSRAASGSDAAQQFLNGTGDVLLSYESEAITARASGEDVDYVVPDQTVLIQTVAAVTTNASKAAKDFLDYAESSAGQQIVASKGWRPALTGVDPGTVHGALDPSNPYPQPQTLTTIDDLGGWDAVNDKFFSENGIVTKIEASG